ncbi:MAG: hypothetical protein M3R36_11110 [Bacteroidota bacterium]|nr:hypothetical protein [Bacteroidota bacterium]
METAILKSNSKENLNLLLDLAKKLNVNVKVLSEEELEDIGLAIAIKKGRTGKFINTKAFLKKIRK